MSDVYVRLGYEFNIACRAFNAIGVDTSDLGPVPDLLRSILEDTLSQEALSDLVEFTAIVSPDECPKIEFGRQNQREW